MMDEEDEPPPPTIGGASSDIVTDEEEHGSHTFLYVPDLTMETGWSTHRVPDRQVDRKPERPMGFRR